MIAAKHTQGEWHRNIPPASRYPTIFAGRNTHVARVIVSPGMTPEEIEANADLLTAAPDLLSEHQEWALLIGNIHILALQEDLQGIKRYLEGIEVHFPNGEPEAKSAAIAKAAGGEA